MKPSEALVSVGLPVRNGADRIGDVAASVLAQDHERIELVICDNASTDDTESVCRALVASDSRIAYRRHPVNVGLLNNFISAIEAASGTYFRWIGDDDWIAPNYVSRCLDAFADDDRRLLVTTQLTYTDQEGVTRWDRSYDGSRLASSDPLERFEETVRLCTESHLLFDPLYALVRREPVAAIPRRNILREDQVFATKLALAGPWGHVPEILGTRHTKVERMPDVARRLGIPVWQAHLSTTLQCQEILRWIGQIELTKDQRRRARSALGRMFVRRLTMTYGHRARKMASLATSLVRNRSRGSSVGGR